jgi:hypothetical protein
MIIDQRIKINSMGVGRPTLATIGVSALMWHRLRDLVDSGDKVSYNE